MRKRGSVVTSGREAVLLLSLTLGVMLVGGTPCLAGDMPGGGGEGARTSGALPAHRLENAPLWTPFEAGFEKDETVRRSGAFTVRCVNRDASEKRGALWTYPLDQKQATPIVVAGWSRAERVDGPANSDYAVYVDLQYADGSYTFGAASPFNTGTHDWERRRVIITPDRPLKTLFIYALFRGHAGKVWFDDFSVTPVSGKGFFDGQPLTPPHLPQGAASGWFVRDVAANGALLALTPGGKPVDGIALSGLKTERKGRIVRAALKAGGDRCRAVTLYYVERFDAPHPVWWKTIRETQPLAENEAANVVTAGGAGATGTQTRYPFGCVTGDGAGRAIAVPPDLGPRIARIGFHPGAHLLYIAFDLALTPERGPSPVAAARYAVSPEWGFREAAQAYYALFPAYYERRTKAEGIWLPFTDPAKIPNVADFGVAWHEGDNSVESDDKLGVLSFRYVEPMSFWMVMPPQERRDYDTALARLKRLASGEEKAARSPEEAHLQALATLASGSKAPDGRFNVQFQNAPWANGAVWTLNPNPRMPGEWNKARVNYDRADADRRYSKEAKGVLDGEYLDSMEGWADVLDYGAESIKRSIAPPTFASETFQPVLPTWFSVWEYTAWLREDLRRRGKLLMGNSTPWSLYAFVPLLDASGTETGWLGGDGGFQPENDAFMCWRRTLCGRKPYLLLQNTDFDKFGRGHVEKYMQRCLFYGIFPSMFSVNAADKPYWENPKWYERDRELFKKYIPVIKTLSAAGWEPVTYARSDRPEIYLERFGKTYLTLLNAAQKPVQTTITIDLAALQEKRKAAPATITDLFAALRLDQETASDQKVRVTLTVQPGETRVLRLLDEAKQP